MRATPTRLLGALVCGTLLGNSGCYAYLEPEQHASALPAESPVRLALTDSASLVLRDRLGERAEAITGLLEADSAGVYVVRTTSVSYRSGDAADWRGERLTVPKALVASLSVRQFSAGRTALLTSALAFAFLAARKVFGGTSDNTTPVIGFPRPGGQ